MINQKVALIGYSGHAFVIAEMLQLNGLELMGYCEKTVKPNNPFHLPYLGFELDADVLGLIGSNCYFPAIGDNNLRMKTYLALTDAGCISLRCIHPRSTVSALAEIGEGTAIMAGALINPLVKVGKGVIINTGSIIEHECTIGDFSHIAPGAVLAGNVTIGKGSFIGANAVIKQGVCIGANVTVGAGSVILKDVIDGVVVKGNPGK